MASVSAQEYVGKTPGWLRFLFSALLFALVFGYPWEAQNLDSDYLLFPDSPTYVGFAGWTHPWRSHRSIGYPAFLYPFLYPEHHKFLDEYSEALKKGINVWGGGYEPIYAIAEKTGFAGKFEAVVLAQRVILALSISIFYLSLCRWFPPFFSFAALLAALWMAPPQDPRLILTEPLSSALVWLCCACLLYACKSTRRATCLALACLCAALAFLVRPQTLFLTGLCSLIFLYQVIRERKCPLAVFFKTAITFSPLLLSYGYIGWLSLTGGQLFLHTHPNIYYSKFSFFAETEDSQYMPTERAKRFTAWFGKHKAELIDKMKNGKGGYARINFTEHDSPARKRVLLGDGLSYGPLLEVWRHFRADKEIANLSLLERVNFGKELTTGLLHRHAGEMLLSSWQSFIAGLGYYKDIWRLANFPGASFAINIIAFMLGVFAIALRRDARWPIVILLGVHLGALLTAALGHFMLGRYVDPTEAFWLLAGMCSLWALRPRSFSRLKTAAPGVPASMRREEK